MRTSSVLVPALALAAVLCGYLGYRVIALERRVDALARQLGAPAEQAAGGQGGAARTADADHEQRIAALERELRAARDDLRSLEEATADLAPVPNKTPADPGMGDQRILSVLGREQSRIRDRQLEFHRSRWLEWRQNSLDEFAAHHALSPLQADRLSELLANEVDALVDILRSPDSVENPDRAANAWLDRLEATDRAAHQVLSGEQLAAWDMARTIERRVLWPWLPNR